MFKHYEETLNGKIQDIGKTIYQSVHDPSGIALDSLPDEFGINCTEKNLKLLMRNLAYAWSIFHGQTFSFTSVLNNVYMVPSLVRKPLKSLEKSIPKTMEEKR